MMPNITEEMVMERLELYKKELQQLYKMISTYEGAIQDCNYWLSKLAQKEEKVEKDGSD